MADEITKPILPDAKASIPLFGAIAGPDDIGPVSSREPEKLFDDFVEVPPEFVTVQEYNADKDVYENREVRLADITARSMQDREVELRDASDLDTSSYDQNYHYYWANKDNAHPSYNEARRKGYAPVRKSDAFMHQVRKIEGLGEVVTLGDLVLMQVPTALHDSQENKRLHARAIERSEMVNPHHHELLGMIDGDRIQLKTMEHGVTIQNFDENGQPIAPDPRSQFRGQMQESVRSSDYDRATQMAQSLDAARAYSGLEGRNSFGGFGGPMGGGIPESPYLRNR